MTKQTNSELLIPKWENAKGFLINGMICGDFSINSSDDDDNVVSFYIYKNKGLYAEYFIDTEELDNGKLTDEGIVINYSGEPLEIKALTTLKIN